jgi:hypothetical protein
MAAAFAPPAGVALVLLAAAFLWNRAAPAPALGTIEDILLAAQMERARTLAQVDVLVIGDSSALMDVDATVLGDALHLRVDTLATVGYSGPLGFVRLAETYAAQGRRLPTLVFLVHGTSLAITEESFRAKGLEALVLGKANPNRSPVGGARRQIVDGGIRRAVHYPLPGSFGRHYGWPEDLVAALERGHGTLLDPGQLGGEAGGKRPFSFELSPAVRARLPGMADSLVKLAPERIVVAITPVPEGSVGPDTLAQREAVAKELVDALRLPPGALLPLPAAMPDGDFASFTHLGASGRARYTALLAARLR